VSCPLYSVRFNSAEHIAQHRIEIGAKVYCVPNVSEWTHYVFLEHIKAYVYFLFLADCNIILTIVIVIIIT